MRFNDTIRVSLQPSRILRIASLSIHAAAMAVVAILALHRPFFWVCIPVLLVLAWLGERRFNMRAPHVPVDFYWAADHQMQLQAKNGQWLEGECVAARSLAALWVWLHFRRKGSRVARGLFIPFDATRPEVHRRLRARCRVCPPDSEKMSGYGVSSE